MTTREERARERSAELAELAPGGGWRARLDRGAWAAVSQGAPGTWSWGRVALTVGLGGAAAVVLYLTVYRSLDWLVGLAIAYACLTWRARVVHLDYLKRRGS